MNKKDFLELVKNNGNLKSQAEAEEIVDLVLNTIKESLIKGEEISFNGFGSFTITKVKERKGVIPGTSKKYIKPAHKTPKFKFSKKIKEAIA
jgi:DNA-binding protein HU-beta